MNESIEARHAATRCELRDDVAAEFRRLESKLDTCRETIAALNESLRLVTEQRDGWKRLADDGFASFAKDQAEISRLAIRLGTIQRALEQIVAGSGSDDSPNALHYDQINGIASRALEETAAMERET